MIGKGGLGYRIDRGISGDGLNEAMEFKKISDTRLIKAKKDELQEYLNSVNEDIKGFENGDYGILGGDEGETQEEIIQNLKKEKDEIASRIAKLEQEEEFKNELNISRDDYRKMFEIEGIKFDNSWNIPKSTTEKLLEKIASTYDENIKKKENTIRELIKISGDGEHKDTLDDIDIPTLNKIYELSKLKHTKRGYEGDDKYIVNDLIENYEKSKDNIDKLYDKEFKKKMKALDTTEEFDKEVLEREEYLKNIENIDINDFEEDKIKEEAETIVNNYEELKKEYNNPNYYKGDYEDGEKYFGGTGDNNFEISYIPLKDKEGIETKTAIDEKTGKKKVVEIYFKEDYEHPLLESCGHLSSLIYSLDNEEWNKMIKGNAKVIRYVNTDVNTYENINGKKELIYGKKSFNVYDNLVEIEYKDEDGNTKIAKYTIENKHYQNAGSKTKVETGKHQYDLFNEDTNLDSVIKKNKLKRDYTYKNILETNEKVELKYLKDEKSKDIRDINDDIEELDMLMKIAVEDNDKKEIKRLKNEIEKKEKEIISILNKTSPYKKTINLTLTKTGLILDEKLTTEGSFSSPLQYEQAKNAYGAKTVPKFDENGKISGFVKKNGSKIDKVGDNKLLIGSKLLVDMTLVDREIGINYSKLIKEGKIIPSNILKTQPLTKDKNKQSSFNAVGFFENQVHIIKNAPTKIIKSTSPPSEKSTKKNKSKKK
jgi:hypothetical protein